jgi:hypothetical protein
MDESSSCLELFRDTLNLDTATDASDAVPAAHSPGKYPITCTEATSFETFVHKAERGADHRRETYTRVQS